MSQPLFDRNILLGVCGGIAAYKTPQLVRVLRQAGADVQVVMTASAHQFVTATSLQAVSGHAVRDTLWDPTAEAQMGHIELARWADLLLIAPATADRLSRMASGHADDLLGAIYLASRAKVAVAPAMNQVMWEAPATQRNLGLLGSDGVTLIGPDIGEQACGEFGPGRMTEPEEIGRVLSALFSADPRDPRLRAVDPADDQLRPDGPLSGRHVVITAGPTREAIDPVRYISNHSSGKQGYAMAAAALAAGAKVTLISGPVAVQPPAGARVIPVESARQMHEASLAAASECDIFIAVAAVADYRPASAAHQKIKKSTRPGNSKLQLDLVENPDIVADVARLPDRPLVVVGFAAETHDLLSHARAKLSRKGLDAIVVNDVSGSDIGFGTEHNAATLIWADGELILERQDKATLARRIIDQLVTLFVRQLAHTNPENVAN